MPRIAPQTLAAVVLLTATAPHEPARAGFDYCAPPVVPGCIEQTARSRNQAALDACNRQVLRFTQTLGAYRTCLTRESERAVLTGNDAIARFRCMSLGHGACGRGETER